MLIHAGAGGVGSIAIQLAKAKGAHVTTTASAGQMPPSSDRLALTR